MRSGVWLVVGLVVGIVAGAAVGVLLGGATAQPTTTVTLVTTQTVTAATPGVKMSPLEEAILNGTYWSRCVLCAMLINDTKYAALVILKGGHAVRTDDIGCIFRMALLPPEKWKALRNYPAEEVKRLVQVERVFVPDYHTGEYVEAQKAFYVIRQDMKTPMGDCVLAFKSREEASKINATVYTYDQMLQLYKQVMEKTGMPMPMWCRGEIRGDQHHQHNHGS